MRERYLGDSHDFLKYALLRHQSGELGLRLGVNGYASPAYVWVGCCGESSGLTATEERAPGGVSGSRKCFASPQRNRRYRRTVANSTQEYLRDT